MVPFGAIWCYNRYFGRCYSRDFGRWYGGWYGWVVRWVVQWWYSEWYRWCSGWYVRYEVVDLDELGERQERMGVVIVTERIAQGHRDVVSCCD